MAEFMAGKWQKNGKAGADDKRNYNVLCLYRPKLGWRQSRPEAICGRFGAAFCWQNEAEGGKRMTKDLKKQHQWGKISLQMQRRLQTAAIVCYMVVMFVQPAAAASSLKFRAAQLETPARRCFDRLAFSSVCIDLFSLLLYDRLCLLSASVPGASVSPPRRNAFQSICGR